MRSAVGIFAKQPVPGKVKTRLVPPLTPVEAAELYLCMLRDTMDAFCSIPGTDSFIFFDGDPAGLDLQSTTVCQKGEGLGERLKHAFEYLFQSGYDRVVIIGTDSPDLPPAYVSDGLSLLSPRRPAVFGPSADGGYYLAGLSARCYEIFDSIPWSTGQVLARTLESARTCGIATSILPVWYDIDTGDDLGLFMSRSGAAAPRTRHFVSAFPHAKQLPCCSQS